MKNEKIILHLDENKGNNVFTLEGFLDGIPEKLTLKGSYSYNEEDTVIIVGEITFTKNIKCGRCTKDFPKVYQVFLEESFFPKKMSNQDFYYQGQSIDLTELTNELVQMSLVENALCDEECKGLCHKCGIDLNEDTCNCDLREINLDFKKLEQLLK